MNEKWWESVYKEALKQEQEVGREEGILLKDKSGKEVNVVFAIDEAHVLTDTKFDYLPSPPFTSFQLCTQYEMFKGCHFLLISTRPLIDASLPEPLPDGWSFLRRRNVFPPFYLVGNVDAFETKLPLTPTYHDHLIFEHSMSFGRPGIAAYFHQARLTGNPANVLGMLRMKFTLRSDSSCFGSLRWLCYLVELLSTSVQQI